MRNYTRSQNNHRHFNFRRRTKKAGFANSGLIIGFAVVLVVIFIASYFFSDKLLKYEPVEFGTILDNPKYYSKSDVSGWHTINTEIFEIQTPREFRFFRLRGFDSFVGGLTNLQDTFFFDYGLYSNPLDHLTPPDFEVYYKSINGRDFRIVVGKDDLNYIAAYTNELKNENKLMIECPNCSNPEEKYKILQTIEFTIK